MLPARTHPASSTTLHASLRSVTAAALIGASVLPLIAAAPAPAASRPKLRGVPALLTYPGASGHETDGVLFRTFTSGSPNTITATVVGKRNAIRLKRTGDRWEGKGIYPNALTKATFTVTFKLCNAAGCTKQKLTYRIR